MNETLTAVAAIIIKIISASGYSGITFLMALESACVPVPSEIVMPFAGFLVHTGQLKLIWVATAGAVGCNLGSIPAYWLGAWGGRSAVERFGRYLLLSEHDLTRVESFFNKYGSLAVLVGRLLPLVRTVIALPAGVAKMNQIRFHLFTFIGSWPWSFLLAYAGMKLGDHWETDGHFRMIVSRFHLGVELVLATGFVWFVISRWKNRVGERKT